MKRIVFWCALACAAATSGLAEAARGDRANCLSFTLGRRAHVDKPVLGGGGVNACDSALTDPKRPIEDPLLRANLVRARAVHRLAGKDYGNALVDFDLAERAVPNGDIFFKRSFPVANDMMRAFIRGEQDDQTGAIALSRAAAAARPFDMDLAYAAARLEFALDHDLETYLGKLHDQARYDPNRIQSLFVIALIRRKYAEALELYPHILLTVPRGRGEYVVAEAAIAADNLLTRAHLTGGRAYAYAATGQPRFARAVLTAFQAEVARAMTEPVRDPDAKLDPHLARRADWKAYLTKKSEIEAAIAHWTRLADLRLQPADPGTAEAVAAMIASPEAADPTVLDLALAVRSAQPGNAVITDAMMDRLHAGEAFEMGQLAKFTLTDLLSGLPDMDYDARQPKYDGGSDSSILMDEGGYMSRAGPMENSRTLKFTTTGGTGETATELVYLRAAQMAREQNKKGFIVLARRSLPRSVIVGNQSYPGGYEAEIDVAFVDPAALPEPYAEAGWRVVDADALWTAQSAIYIDARAALRREREAAKKR
jgi:hypothetical protein